MPRKEKPEPLPSVPCTNCQAPVQQRKPSATGLHFCQRRPCVNAKQKKYRELRAQTATEDAANQTIDGFALLVTHLVGPDPYKTCSTCGAQKVLAGWGHRRLGQADAPCFGAGSAGKELGVRSIELLDIVMPHLTPTVQRLDQS